MTATEAGQHGGDEVNAPTRPREETHRLGDEIYERNIRSRVETDHHGEIVAIDVDSGGWAIGENVIVATDRLRAQQPEVRNVWLVRVGHRALRSFGAGSLRRIG